MKVLAINCGSSSLKFQCVDFESGGTRTGHGIRLARGAVDRIGAESAIRFTTHDGEDLSEVRPVADHGEAVRRVLDWPGTRRILARSSPDAVGHRVVHGGEHFVEPALLDEETIGRIESISYLAPLHNQPALKAIRASRSILGTAVPQVAVFDTAFHATLPEHAARYAIPMDMAEKHRIRRYGFHGLAHRYMTERYAGITGTPVEHNRLITLQLGNGCSATAVANGRSVDTSMGFTPLEGLVMGTRSGDIDPSIIGFLARRENVDAAEIEKWLNSRSGLLGVSGISHDMRELLRAEATGNTRAALAIEMFCYRVRRYIGAYMAVLGRTDAVVFGGGIGENSPEIRARICRGMEWCGLVIDGDLNAATAGVEGFIHARDSGVRACVIPVDEEAGIARDTVRYLDSR